MMQTVGLSKAPVIASHSGVRRLANVSRNMDDEMLMAMKANGGVIQMVAFAGYVKSEPPERGRAVNALRREFGLGGGRGTGAGAGAGGGRGGGAPAPGCPVEDGLPAVSGGGGGGAAASAAALTPDRRAEFERRLADIDRTWPAAGRATVGDFVDGIDYAVGLIGVDHVGISSDFDGGGGIDGWTSAAETFNVTLELVRRGYTEEQIGKIWGGNLLRVWNEVERVARDIQAGRP
jgi:membrane dipeptidase